MDAVRNTATASTQTNAALSRAVRERQVSDTRVGRLDLSRTNRADCVTLRHGGRIESGPPRRCESEPERVGAAHRAAVHRYELVVRADQGEDLAHVGAEAEARHRDAGDPDSVRQVAHGEAGVVHHLAAGVARQPIADPVEPIRSRELDEQGQVRNHLAELRIALLDEEDVAVPVVHHGLADRVPAEDASRAEGAGDAGNHLEARVDLYEREVLADAAVPTRDS